MTQQLPTWAQEIVDDIRAARKEAVRAQAKERLKDIPEAWWKHAELPESPSEVDAWATGVRSGFEEFQKSFQPENTVADEIRKWAGAKETPEQQAGKSDIEKEILTWAQSRQSA